MILWCDGAHAPDENMRRDEALLAALESAPAAESSGAAQSSEGAHPEAVLRLFRFEPHGITLGRAQRPAQALDLERCRADGVPWAVRPTGGRAIFHAEEWTYSLAAGIADPEWGGSLSEAYDRAATLILRSLLRLGVPAALVPRDTRGGAESPRAEADSAPAAPGRRRDLSGAACFASTARHEIVLGGRKLVGSAQRRGARALLQQGSLLLGPGHERLADYLDLPDARRAAVRSELAMSATHAGGILGAQAPLARWADALMAELPAGTRRIEGDAGASLLTLAEAASYTARLP
jgi:lipoate-protein ligase A